jgi:hypothetical protein
MKSLPVVPPVVPQSTAPRRRRARRFLLAAAGIAGLGAAASGLWLHAHHVRVERAAAEASSRADAFRIHWTPGLAYTFAFAWSGESEATLARGSAARIATEYDLAGDLVARAVDLGGRTVLELRLDALTHHSLKALGAETIPTDALAHTALEQPRAFALVGPNGAVDQLRFPTDAPKPFREVLTKLVEQMQVTLADDAPTPRDWTATEPGPNGRAASSYHLEHEGPAGGLALTRVRVEYESLSALSSGACEGCAQHLNDHADITLDPRGVVGAIQDDESLRLSDHGADAFASTNHFSLTLTRVEAAEGALSSIADAVDARTPGERAPLTTSDRDAILAQEAEGFAPSTLDYAIDLFAKKGERPPDKTWLVHARAYLLLHPEALDALGARLADPKTDSRGRNMMLQVLAVVGSPRAQEIMRGAIDAAQPGETPRDFGHLVQKLGVVEHPTAETAAYVEDGYRRDGARGNRAMALSDAATLGGVASHLAKSGDASASRHIVARLEADLGQAKDPEDKRGLILALRNAGAVADADVRAYAVDESASVRGEVARSLADDTSPDARATLLSLTTDGEITVAGTALQSLDRDSPTPDDIHAIATSVLTGKTAPVLDGDVMDFFAGHMSPPDDARTVLGFLLARTQNPALARRLRALLAQLPS